MRLSELAPGLVAFGADTDPEIVGVTEDSRRVRPGMLFVAVPGSALDGHAYIPDAVSRGAAAVVVERAGAVPPDMPFIRVASARAALASLAARFYESPPAGLELIGFTGTFGKTSTSEILRALLDAGGRRTAVMGSLGARYGGFTDPGSGLTTPAPPEMHRGLRHLADAGADTVIMEVTSHALMLERVAGLSFAGGLIAAIMPGEHTDFHRSYEEYVAAKRLFLDHLAPDATLAYDADNRAARQLASEASLAASAGVSLEAPGADLQLKDIVLDDAGAAFTIAGPSARAQSGTRLYSALLGRGHLHNVALALSYAIAAGVTSGVARDVLGALKPLRRRMERYDIEGRGVLDDTAAHPDSLGAAFEVARLVPSTGLVVVYALRGQRGADINRRSALALADLAAVHGARHLIVTAAADHTAESDHVDAAEVEAARQAFVERGRRFVWHDALHAAVQDALVRSTPGDLLMLLGARGMNEGRRILESLG